MSPADVRALQPGALLVARFFDEGWRAWAAKVQRQFISRGSTRLWVAARPGDERLIDLMPSADGRQLFSRARVEFFLDLPTAAEAQSIARLLGGARLDSEAEPETEITMNSAAKELKGNSPKKKAAKAAAKKATAKKAAPKNAAASDRKIPAAGAEFTKSYKGTEHKLTVGRKDGEAIYTTDGQAFSSPSAAAVHVTGKPTNGWTFWGIEKVTA